MNLVTQNSSEDFLDCAGILYVTNLVTQRSNPITTKIKLIITLRYLADGKKSYWEDVVVQ